MLGYETAGHVVWLAGCGVRDHFKVLQEEGGQRGIIYGTLAYRSRESLS
jgi:hypothetical protein